MDAGAIVERILAERLADGGWNCDVGNGSEQSSFDTTINVLDGLLEFERATGGPAEVRTARAAIRGSARHGVGDSDGVLQLRPGHDAAFPGCHHRRPRTAHVARVTCRCAGCLSLAHHFNTLADLTFRRPPARWPTVVSPSCSCLWRDRSVPPAARDHLCIGTCGRSGQGALQLVFAQASRMRQGIRPAHQHLAFAAVPHTYEPSPDGHGCLAAVGA